MMGAGPAGEQAGPWTEQLRCGGRSQRSGPDLL